MIELQDGLTILKTKTECRDIFCCDHFENEPLSPLIDHIMNESTGQIRYYVGNPTVPDTTTNLVMSLKTDKIEINKPAVLSDVLNTNTIDSNGISDITFRRNIFDIFYLRNSNLELNAGIDLVAPAQVQSNTYNSYDDSGVLLLRNGDEFMRFRKAEDDILVSKDVVIDSSKKLTLNNIDVPTATNLLFKVSGVTKLTLSNTDLKIPVGTNLLSDIIYGNSFGARQLGTDTSLYGSNAVGDTNVEYFRLNKTNETVNYIKDIVINNANQSNANIINTNGNSNLFFQRNDVDMFKFTTTDLITEPNIHLVSQGQVKCDIINSYGDDNLSIRRYGTEYLLLNSNPAPVVIPCVGVASGIGFTCEKFFCDEFRSKNDNVNIAFYGGNSAGNGKVNSMTYGRVNEEMTFHRDVNIDTGYNLTGDVIIGNSIHGTDCFANRFRVRHMTEDTTFDGANTTEDGRFTFMVYRHTQEDLGILGDVLIDNGYKMSSNIYNSSGDNDVVFKRNGVDYFKLQYPASTKSILCLTDTIFFMSSTN